MTLYMETTEVKDHRTVAEIQDLLSKNHATAVMVNYDHGKVSAVSFQLTVDGQVVPFRLPCRWNAVEVMLRKTGRNPRKGDTWEDWSRRVAWRQILRWVQAQLAMVETGMVKTQEVFLPYVMVGGAKTMYEVIEGKKFLALTAPEKD